MGIKRALKHLPPQVLQRQNYHRLVDLLDDADSAKVLHHAAKIDDLAVQVLAELPPPLRRPLPLALSDWPRKLNGFAQSLEFLVARGMNGSFDDLVAQLATVTARPQLRAMVRGWVESLPLPETIPPARIGNARRLDNSKELRSLARTWRNCLDSYTEDIDAGSCAVYLWDDADSSAACLVRRHGRLGWFLDEVKGPRNADLEPRRPMQKPPRRATASAARSTAGAAPGSIAPRFESSYRLLHRCKPQCLHRCQHKTDHPCLRKAAPNGGLRTHPRRPGC
jgi:hypothetical protein